MKKTFFILGILVASNTMAQIDSTITINKDTISIGNMIIVGDKSSSKKKAKNKREAISINIGNDTLLSVISDTVKVGNLRIINKSEEDKDKRWAAVMNGDFKKTKIMIDKSPRKQKNVRTNWLMFDLGFANWQDKTAPLQYAPYPYNLPYQNIMAPAPSSSNLKLNNAKTSNVNIWVVQQKVNLSQHQWNLKYGIGIEMYNFRFEQPISFRNTPGSYVYFDNVNFSKNKLFVEYLTVPIQINYQSNPEVRKSFYASIGLSGGYLLQSHTKQISTERGKQKVYGSFDLNNTKLATIGEIGIGGIRLYGSYSLTNLFDKNLTTFNLAPYAIGLRFSRF